jgi:hypothetical protein
MYEEGGKSEGGDRMGIRKVRARVGGRGLNLGNSEL